MPGTGGRPGASRRLSEAEPADLRPRFQRRRRCRPARLARRGPPFPDGLEILSCCPISALPGSAVDRTTALAALRSFIAGMPDAIIGCDFPFSLPRNHIGAASWPDFIDGFRHADALTFYEHCRRASGGKEPKRATDVESQDALVRLQHSALSPELSRHGRAVTATGGGDQGAGPAHAAAGQGPALAHRDLSCVGATPFRLARKLQGRIADRSTAAHFARPDGRATAAPSISLDAKGRGE